MPRSSLIFIQASLGQKVPATQAFYPNNVLENVAPEGEAAISSLAFMVGRMKRVMSEAGIALAVLTSRSEQDAPVRETSRKLGLPCIMADEGALGSSLHRYLRNSVTYARVVRLLANNTFTEPELVLQSIEEFKKLPEDIQQSHKQSPDVSRFGQNIEVFTASCFLRKYGVLAASGSAEEKAKFEESITSELPSAPEWNVLSLELEAQMKAADFRPIVSQFPGYPQEHSANNIRQIVGYHQKHDLPFDIKTIFATWQRLKLQSPQWRWSDPEFKPQTFGQIAQALGRGINTVAQTPPPAFL